MNLQPLLKIIQHTTRQTPPSLHPTNSRFNSVMDKILVTDCYHTSNTAIITPHKLTSFQFSHG